MAIGCSRMAGQNRRRRQLHLPWADTAPFSGPIAAAVSEQNRVEPVACRATVTQLGANEDNGSLSFPVPGLSSAGLAINTEVLRRLSHASSPTSFRRSQPAPNNRQRQAKCHLN